MTIVFRMMRGIAHFNVGAVLALAAWLATAGPAGGHEDIQRPVQAASHGEHP